MAIAATRKTNGGANPGSAVLSLKMQDVRHNLFSVSLRVVPDISDAQIGVISDAIESISNAKICDFSLTLPGNISGGKAAATALMYPDKYQMGRFSYASSADCRERIFFTVGAPLSTIFVGVENRIVSDTNALVIALNASLAGVLASKDGATDFVYDSGYRDGTNMPTPQL
jgi:hypothetical protein